MQLAVVVDASDAVAATSKRGEKTSLLAAVLRAAAPDELPIVACWLAGRLPQGRIGVGYRAITKAAGTVPAALDGGQLTVASLHARLTDIGAIAGKGSTARRSDALCAALALMDDAQQRWLLSILAGGVRQGALDGVVIAAVAKAAGVKVASVRRSLMLRGDLGEVARAALEGGEAALRETSLQLFRPVVPMLAQTADTVDGALGSLGEALFEQKLDGARIQVHKDGELVRVFTRKLREVTGSVPEVVEAARAMPARRLVLDGEVLALDDSGAPLPFQTTMRRFGRKLEVESMRDELPLAAGFFDCLQIDDEIVVDATLSDRRAALTAASGGAHLVPSVVTADPLVAAGFLEVTLAAGHEGVMAKGLDASYEAGKRGKRWLKLKPVHTLDFVVLAAEWGSGRRRGWLSNLHLGARDGAGWAMLGKTFKGMTDEVLAWQTAALLARETRRDGHIVFVRPELVVEIAFNEVQASPHYPSGVALRFARLKGYRADKSPTEADTIETVRHIQARGFRDR